MNKLILSLMNLGSALLAIALGMLIVYGMAWLTIWAFDINHTLTFGQTAVMYMLSLFLFGKGGYGHRC